MNPTTEAACKLCADTKVNFFVKEGVSFVKRCKKCNEVCSQCDGTGAYSVAIEEEEGWSYEAVKNCSCQKLETGIQRYNEARVPAHFNGSNGDLEALGFFDDSPMFFQVYTAVTNWILDYTGGATRRGFLIYGPPGTGKTRLGIGALRELSLKYRYRVKFVEYSLLLSDLRMSFEKSSESSNQIIRNLLDCDVLMIDELGKGRATAWEQQILDEIITRSYNSQKTIIATTNIDFRKALCGDTPPDLDVNKYIPERVRSRMEYMMGIWPLFCPDYRITRD